MRIELSNKIDELSANIQDYEVKSAAAHADIAGLVDQAIAEHAYDLKRVWIVLSNITFLEMLLSELHTRLRAARFALWQHDLEAQKSERGKAAKAATDARLETLNCQADKSNYLRAAKGVPHEDQADRIANYDILLIDARSKANSTATYRDKAKAALESMQAEYNEIAKENGWPLEPEKPEPVPMIGLS